MFLLTDFYILCNFFSFLDLSECPSIGKFSRVIVKYWKGQLFHDKTSKIVIYYVFNVNYFIPLYF